MAAVHSIALDGLAGRPVEVEVDIASGLSATVVVGLADTTVSEARNRVRSAVVNSGTSWPDTRVTISLAPSSLPKSGSHYDLSSRRVDIIMRAGIYTRISRDREGAGLGVDRQEQDCRELAARLGWEIVDIYSDNDVSAYSGRMRPGYKRLLQDVEAGVIGGIIAWHTDRLHRRTSELEEFVTLCEKHGTAVQTVRSGSVDLSTASGRMVARMLGAAAQHEVDHARERMKRAKAQAAQEGRWRGGPRPFGYEADGVTVRPDEAAQLLAATQAVVAGRSLSSLARELNESGSAGTRGSAWSPNRLRKALLRPRNAGLLEVGGEVTREASWPAIVPEELWRACRATLTDPARKTNTRGAERRWLGSGLYRCGVCEGPLRANRSNGISVYRCQSGSHVSRGQEAVDAYVIGVLKEYLERDDVRAALVEQMSDETPAADLTEVQALRNRQAAFEADYAAGDISGRQLREATERVQAEVDAVEKRIARRSQRNALASLASSSSPAAAFSAARLDTQRGVVDALIDVVINPGKRGRPVGWRPGMPYSDLGSVSIEWKGRG